MSKRYTVSDGKLMLVLEEAREGGFTVTSPMDPAVVTEADSIREAFQMARDAMRALAQGRRKLARGRIPSRLSRSSGRGSG